jgi:hypothetical protein
VRSFIGVLYLVLDGFKGNPLCDAEAQNDDIHRYNFVANDEMRVR